MINAPLIRPPLFIISFRPKWESCGGSSRTRTCVLRRMRSCWSHLQSYCHIRFAWLTSLVLRDCNPLIPVLALGRVTIKTEKMVRGCDLMQIRLGAGGGTRTHTVSPPADFESATSTIPSHRHILSRNSQNSHRREQGENSLQKPYFIVTGKP